MESKDYVHFLFSFPPKSYFVLLFLVGGIFLKKAPIFLEEWTSIMDLYQNLKKERKSYNRDKDRKDCKIANMAARVVKGKSDISLFSHSV